MRFDSKDPKRGSAPPTGTAVDIDRGDLGFGAVVSRESRQRLLNRDGTFNVERAGLSHAESWSAYHTLLTTSWTRFVALLVAFYVVSNTLFAVAYLACGPQALVAPDGDWPGPGFWRAFFFSVQTFATIGYGHVHPTGLAANLLVTLESLYGLLGFALFTGLLFARFSRPSANILFSRAAVIAPYREGRAWMFRIANKRRSELFELQVQVIFSWFAEVDGRRQRRYQALSLERDRVSFFPLTLTVVHPIDAASPLRDMDEQALHQTQGEFLVLLSAIDEGFQASVHARSSYDARDVAWGKRFVSVFDGSNSQGTIRVDVSRLHDVQEADLPRVEEIATA